ncbi:PIN domain-containing protein [Nodularia sp. NIES-3585]|uniref:PIN domain-containing protein n=1 Tax=Nodularia sp. NIES-3585 TaxID=1973477 RepID=UPI000B5C31F0|nr:PIN domain-containing protein [Nodularia sp. NIES-3585]
MIIIYIETNCLMAIAKGQDSQASVLLSNPPNSVEILIPNICYIESICTYKIEENNCLQFQQEMRKKIRELARDKTSFHAHSFLEHLEQAAIENICLINDIKSRLDDAMENLRNNAKIIALDNNVIQDICQTILTAPERLPIKKDIMDNLILQCILNHATYCKYEKVFISNNTKDFDTPDVREALRQAGIRYFTMTQHFLDWFTSSSN